MSSCASPPIHAVYAQPWTASEAYGFLNAVLLSPSARVLTATDRHAEVLSRCLADVPEARGNLVHDLHAAVLMRDHGISRIVTRDRNFHRFRFLTVIDALEAERFGRVHRPPFRWSEQADVPSPPAPRGRGRKKR